MFFKDVCILVLWTKVASALEGLKSIMESLPDISHGGICQANFRKISMTTKAWSSLL